MRRARAIAVALAAVAAAAPEAGAALTGTIVGEKSDVYGPELAVARDGGAVAAWTRGRDRIFPLAGGPTAAGSRMSRIQVATGSMGAGFSKPRTLASYLEDDPDWGGPSLAGNRRGDAIVLWRDDAGALRYATRVAGEPFGAARVLASEGAMWSVAAAPDGRFVATWASPQHGPDARISVATGTAAGGLGEPVELPAPYPLALSVQMNRRGTVMVLDEERGERGGRTRLWLRRPGRSFRVAGHVPGVNVGGIAAVLRDDDSVVALVSTLRGLVATYRDPGARFTKPKLYSRDGWFAEVARDPRGAVAATWTLYDEGGAPRGVLAAEAPPRGRFGTVHEVSRQLGSFVGSIAAAGNGRRFIAFDQNHPNGRTTSLRVASWQTGHRPRRGRGVGSGCLQDHRAGVADDGRGLVIWTRAASGGRERGLFFATIDRANPRR